MYTIFINWAIHRALLSRGDDTSRCLNTGDIDRTAKSRFQLIQNLASKLTVLLCCIAISSNSAQSYTCAEYCTANNTKGMTKVGQVSAEEESASGKRERFRSYLVPRVRYRNSIIDIIVHGVYANQIASLQALNCYLMSRSIEWRYQRYPLHLARPSNIYPLPPALPDVFTAIWDSSSLPQATAF